MFMLMKWLLKMTSHLSVHIVTLCESEVTPHKKGFVITYVCGSIHYVVQQLIPSARLHCIHEGLRMFPKQVAWRS
jgi:hypothetical protein